MTKAYCKWPAIIGIVVAVLVACAALYCCCRCLSCCCCDCLSGGRYRRGPKKHKYADLSSSSSSAPPPHPYSYPQAHDPEPPRYAQFERSEFGPGVKQGHADSLPHMPMWDQGKERRVFDDEGEDGDLALRKETGGAGGVELRKLDTPPPAAMPRGYGGDGGGGEEQRAPMLPQASHVEMEDSSYRRVQEADGKPGYGGYASLSPREYKPYTPYNPSA